MSNDHAILDELKTATTWGEMQRKLGEFLGLPEAAPLAVVRRALQDELFRHYLLTARNQPSMLKFLLNDPKNRAYEQAAPVAEQSSTELISKAANALVQWGKGGFGQVDDAVFERRFGACQRCEHLIDPPKKLVYTVTLSQRSDQRICAACGCVAARKARLPTESCPVAHPSVPARNRWDEPLSANRKDADASQPQP